METMQYLRRLNLEIKNNFKRPNAGRKLEEVKLKDLNPGELMYFYYLKGKFHELNAIRDCKIFDKKVLQLELAHENYNEIYWVSTINHIKYKNPKFRFKRAHLKLLLSEVMDNKLDTRMLLESALELTLDSIKLYPNNKQFSWLKNSIERLLSALDGTKEEDQLVA